MFGERLHKCWWIRVAVFESSGCPLERKEARLVKTRHLNLFMVEGR